MATPVLENELYKLRLRLGDIHKLDGEEFTASPSSLIESGHEWSAGQLVYVYNASVVRYIQYILDNQPDKISNLIPGYIVEDSLGLSSLEGNAVQKSRFNPEVFKVINFVVKHEHALYNIKKRIIEYVPSSRWFSVTAGETESADPSIGVTDLPRCYWTELSTHIQGSLTNCFVFYPHDIFQDRELLTLYVKTHKYVSVGDNEDLPAMSQYALERILDFAELMAVRFREYLRAEVFTADKDKLEKIEYISGKGDILK